MDAFTMLALTAMGSHGMTGLTSLLLDVMFVDFREETVPMMETVEGYIGHATYAVVRCLSDVPTPLADCVLLMTGKRDHELILVATDSFHEPVCVVDNIGFPEKSVFVLRPRKDWAEEFC
jgi:hypothetical protein